MSPREASVTVSIDGKEVTVPSGTLICARCTSSSVNCVKTFMPSATGVEHEVISFRWPSTFT